MTGGERTGSAATVVPVEGSLAGAVMLMTGPVSVEVTGATGTGSGATSEGITVSGRWIGGVGAGGTLGVTTGSSGLGMGIISITVVGPSSTAGMSASSKRWL
ncbi:hypothetical protein D3C80_1538230 [compost metagenome]